MGFTGARVASASRRSQAATCLCGASVAHSDPGARGFTFGSGPSKRRCHRTAFSSPTLPAFSRTQQLLESRLSSGRHRTTTGRQPKRHSVFSQDRCCQDQSLVRPLSVACPRPPCGVLTWPLCASGEQAGWRLFSSHKSGSCQVRATLCPHLSFLTSSAGVVTWGSGLQHRTVGRPFITRGKGCQPSGEVTVPRLCFRPPERSARRQPEAPQPVSAMPD